MSLEQDKAIVRRYFEEVWTKGNAQAIDELTHGDIDFYDPAAPGGHVHGAGAVKGFVNAVRTGFPDLTFTVHEIFGEGDRLAARFTWRGTQRGELSGLPPSGREVTMPGASVFHLADGKIRELWVNIDTLGLMRQLGVIPG